MLFIVWKNKRTERMQMATLADSDLPQAQAYAGERIAEGNYVWLIKGEALPLPDQEER